MGRVAAGWRGAVWLIVLLSGTAVAGPTGNGPGPCRCDRFAAELAIAEGRFARRSVGVVLPIDDGARARFRARIEATFEHAACLIRCRDAPPPALNRARALLAAAAYKSRDAGVPVAEIDRRLAAAVAATADCLASEPANPRCLNWHAVTRGRRASRAWNPFLVGRPRTLLAEFRAARAGAPPGHDLLFGAATRGEAALLLRLPRLFGGDRAAALALMEAAARAPRFRCSVSNPFLLAEALAANGQPARARAVLEATAAAGLPACGANGYENALGLADVRRCLAHLTTSGEPWPEACR